VAFSLNRDPGLVGVLRPRIGGASAMQRMAWSGRDRCSKPAIFIAYESAHDT
jgi:hypothetical protein